MAKFNLDLKNLPLYAKILIGSVPSVVIIVVVLFLLVMPKREEIKVLDGKIAKQEDEIARDEAKAAKLPELTLENERLRKRLNELKQQLPEEKEVSTLLRQVSDLALRAGLKIALWRPEPRKVHPSGIVYEIPVRVELSGSYHSLGYFFSSLTKLNRIVNISDIRIANPKRQKGIAIDSISFIATTFSAIPEEEIGKAGKGK
jgi:type IV pilus assembly protein PilO